MLKVIFSAREL